MRKNQIVNSRGSEFSQRSDSRSFRFVLIVSTILLCFGGVNSGLNIEPAFGLGFEDEPLLFEDVMFEEEEVLYLNENKVFSANVPTRVVVGNPNIIDVVNVSEDAIILSPKAVGATSFVYWDNLGEHSHRLRVFSEDMVEVKARIDVILEELKLPNVYTKAIEIEGKVLLLGEVKTKEQKERINLALGELAEKTTDLIKTREDAIVDIDVEVIEVDSDSTKTLGFQLPVGGTITAAEKAAGALKKSFDSIFHVFDWKRTVIFQTQLDFLIQEGKARILSRPRLSCLSGKEAELLVGGEKPILTTEISAVAGSQSTEVDYKEYGIKFNIKPTVTDDKRVLVALNVEVSEVGDAEILGTVAQPTAKAYPLTKRNISTELYLNDGQTVGIGGLIRQKEEEVTKKTAFLGDIPIIGLLFRHKETKKGGGRGELGDTELFIMLTPRIVSQQKDASGSTAESSMHAVAVSQGREPADIITQYTNQIKKIILDNMSYPSLAKEAGFQGTVMVSLRLSSDGELLGAVVSDSSGNRYLDENTILVAKRILFYPPFPSSLDISELWVEVPIVYQLQ